jgi:2-methylisocitrate lyase-like PEP mutase family enzyme
MSAKLFRELHHGPAPLLLANAWDAGSARLIESLGAKAIATTSAGLAWSRGYADGNALPIDELLVVVQDIVRVIRVPLTIDIEAGYSQDPNAVGQLATRVVDTGAVGINIEDGAGSPELLCTKIDAIRRATSRSGIDLFINTRTDVFLRGLASGHAASVAEVIRRAALYRAAGCDGLFVPGLADVAGMAAIAGAIGPLPLNIMAVPGLPALDVLVKNGVRRLSAGSAIAQAALGCTSRLAENFLAGTMNELFTGSVPYGAANQLFADRARA